MTCLVDRTTCVAKLARLTFQSLTSPEPMARNCKNQVAVELPTPFVEFMRHVDHLIASGDSATTTESDDLLQCDVVYGGLYDSAERRFGFRYFHGQGDRETWDLDLNAEQISAIAAGTLKKVELWQCPNGKCPSLHAREGAYCPRCDSIRHFDDYETQLRVWRPDEDDASVEAMANLRKIGLAILDYHHEQDHFPPAFTKSSSGHRLHSWRSLVLPYLDCDELFERILFNEPWDSDANRALWDERPAEYRGEGLRSCQTGSVAVVGRDTIWPADSLRTRSDITSGTSHTVAVVRSRVTSVDWMQPADMDVDAVIAEYASTGSVMAVFVDAHVDTIEDVTTDRVRELLSI